MNARPLAARSSRSRERGGIILKLLAALMVVIVLGAMWLLRAPLLRVAGELHIADEVPQPSDAIVVLGNDTYWGERAARAAELYRQRWAPRVIASGTYVRPYATITDLIRRDLIDRGVPPDAVVAYSHFTGNTREEAYAVRRLLREKGWKRLIVATSNYHTRRSRYIYRRVLDPDMQVRVVAAPDSTYDPRSWWQSRLGVKMFFNECVGSVVAFIEMQQDEPDASKFIARPAPAATPARP